MPSSSRFGQKPLQVCDEGGRSCRSLITLLLHFCLCYHRSLVSVDEGSLSNPMIHYFLLMSTTIRSV